MRHLISIVGRVTSVAFPADGPNAAFRFSDWRGRVCADDLDRLTLDRSVQGAAPSRPAGPRSRLDGMFRTTFTAAVATAASLAAGVTAHAATITEFSAGMTTAGHSITAGPDGDVWFTQPSRLGIAKVTASGVITEFPSKIASAPTGIAGGPDGHIWLSGLDPNAISRVTPNGVQTPFVGGVALGASPVDVA